MAELHEPNLYIDKTNNRIGIGATTPAQTLDVVGNHQIRDANTAAKAYRFRTNGGSLDIETGGAQTFISSWDNADFTGTQRYKMVLENGANIVQALKQWQWRDAPNGNTTAQIDGDTGKITTYNKITTAGLGVPAIYGFGRATAQTAANASVATYTVGASDGSFLVSGNVNITAFVAGSINVTCAYTDETNTARTLTLNFSSLTGTIGVAIAAAGGFEGIPTHIRAKASTAITIATTGTFTSLTYNVEGAITQIA